MAENKGVMFQSDVEDRRESRFRTVQIEYFWENLFTTEQRVRGRKQRLEMPQIGKNQCRTLFNFFSSPKTALQKDNFGIELKMNKEMLNRMLCKYFL